MFIINGYWKDDHVEFYDYLVSPFDSVGDDQNDDDIFYFGLSEQDIIDSIKSEGDDALEFVITSYEKA